MFRKGSTIHLQPKKRFNMFASRQVEIPFYRGNDRQREKGIGAVAQFIRRNAISFLPKSIVPAAECVGANSLRQKMQRLLAVEKTSRQLHRLWKDKISENKWLVAARKRLQAEPFQENLQNKPIGREEKSSQTFLNHHVELFLVPDFCGGFKKSWRESSTSWQSFIVPRISNLFCYLSRGKITLIWDRRTWLWN